MKLSASGSFVAVPACTVFVIVPLTSALTVTTTVTFGATPAASVTFVDASTLQVVTPAHAPGTVDADYRGDVGVILVNLSAEDQRIEPGDRIAQIVFAPVTRARLVEAPTLADSARSTGGFGSTGER